MIVMYMVIWESWLSCTQLNGGNNTEYTALSVHYFLYDSRIYYNSSDWSSVLIRQDSDNHHTSK